MKYQILSVFNREDIHLTDQELGRGSWAAVTKATFRGCPVAVKQIHNLIVSPYNVRLFQREMTIASHCRHPCLLQVRPFCRVLPHQIRYHCYYYLLLLLLLLLSLL